MNWSARPQHATAYHQKVLHQDKKPSERDIYGCYKLYRFCGDGSQNIDKYLVTASGEKVTVTYIGDTCESKEKANATSSQHDVSLLLTEGWYLIYYGRYYSLHDGELKRQREKRLFSQINHVAR